MQPAAFYNQIARDTNTSIEVNTLSNLLSRKEMKSEGLYLNAKGYAALAEAIAGRLTTTPR
jgi:lysophospholipase L1-like esterase